MRDIEEVGTENQLKHAKQFQERENVSSNGVGNPVKVIRNPENVVSLEKFMDLLNSVEEIPDITKSEKSLKKAESKELNWTRSETSRASTTPHAKASTTPAHVDKKRPKLNVTRTIQTTTEAATNRQSDGGRL
ncbi:hypothetical protein COOONC_16551 [Cooperia oncophora]